VPLLNIPVKMAVPSERNCTMIESAAIATFAAALFSMMNPIGNVGIFAAMTSERSASEVRNTAWTCALASAITLLIVTWSGSSVLKFFGISVDALRAAGGLIIMFIGLHMLFNQSRHAHSTEEVDDAAERESIAVVPLAIPVVAGPGTMATVLVFAEKNTEFIGKIEISVMICAMAAVTGLIFSFAPRVSAMLGSSGLGVVTRVMGMILTAIAMGMLTKGLGSLLPGLAV